MKLDDKIKIKDDRLEVVKPIMFILKDATFTIPKGFKSDGISYPFPLSLFMRRFGRGLAGAILHDYLLQEKDYRWRVNTRYFMEALKMYCNFKWFEICLLRFLVNLYGLFVSAKDLIVSLYKNVLKLF